MLYYLFYNLNEFSFYSTFKISFYINSQIGSISEIVTRDEADNSLVILKNGSNNYMN